MGSGVPLSIQVVKRVAEHEGVDPTALTPPLHAAIDTDALDMLFRREHVSSESETTVEFTYRDHLVRVTGDGAISVDGSSGVGTTATRVGDSLDN
ncbi:HalOD1 output domain-containing protein [Natronobiforma cellulositropha]|uniref:HalOD1 output domain-containing protein n=1 Tax=Natronobiforma cellulositropha TaxID=1679076 RepID=UPI0021D5AB41|nr:HalOD1 output domain-containing protein [Natronobiforma cellulositropha]